MTVTTNKDKEVIAKEEHRVLVYVVGIELGRECREVEFEVMEESKQGRR